MDANTEHRRAATASEDEWDRMAGAERDGAASIVVIDVQPQGALDLFGNEPRGSAEQSMALDPLDLFTREASAIEAAAVPIALDASFDAAADAVAERLAATAHPQRSWPARRSDPADLVLSDRPVAIAPRLSPVAKPAGWFGSRRFWVAVAVVGLVAAAAVPGMAILGRSPATAPVQSASVAPDVVAQPTTTADSPPPASELSPAPPPRVVAAPAQRPDVRLPSAPEPAAPASLANSRSVPPSPVPERNMPAASASERSAPVNSPGDRNVSPPPPTRTTATSTTSLAAPAVAVPQAPPATRPAAPPEVAPPAAPLPVPSGLSSSPTRLEPRAAATVDLPPASSEPAATLPPSAPPPALPAAAPAALPPRAAAAIPVARPSDNDAIQATLGRYRTAFSGLDASAAGAVWPSVDQKALERAFARLQHQKLTFTTCAIDVRGAQALATCRGTADYVPKVGNKSSRSDPRQWVFNLRKIDERWLIETVNSR